jgi:hypothetical protein
MNFNALFSLNKNIYLVCHIINVQNVPKILIAVNYIIFLT